MTFRQDGMSTTGLARGGSTSVVQPPGGAKLLGGMGAPAATAAGAAPGLTMPGGGGSAGLKGAGNAIPKSPQPVMGGAGMKMSAAAPSSNVLKPPAPAAGPVSPPRPQQPPRPNVIYTPGKDGPVVNSNTVPDKSLLMPSPQTPQLTSSTAQAGQYAPVNPLLPQMGKGASKRAMAPSSLLGRLQKGSGSRNRVVEAQTGGKTIPANANESKLGSVSANATKQATYPGCGMAKKKKAKSLQKKAAFGPRNDYDRPAGEAGKSLRVVNSRMEGNGMEAFDNDPEVSRRIRSKKASQESFFSGMGKDAVKQAQILAPRDELAAQQQDEGPTQVTPAQRAQMRTGRPVSPADIAALQAPPPQQGPETPAGYAQDRPIMFNGSQRADYPVLGDLTQAQDPGQYVGQEAAAGDTPAAPQATQIAPAAGSATSKPRTLSGRERVAEPAPAALPTSGMARMGGGMQLPTPMGPQQLGTSEPRPDFPTISGGETPGGVGQYLQPVEEAPTDYDRYTARNKSQQGPQPEQSTWGKIKSWWNGPEQPPAPGATSPGVLKNTLSPPPTEQERTRAMNQYRYGSPTGLKDMLKTVEEAPYKTNPMVDNNLRLYGQPGAPGLNQRPAPPAAATAEAPAASQHDLAGEGSLYPGLGRGEESFIAGQGATNAPAPTKGAPAAPAVAAAPAAKPAEPAPGQAPPQQGGPEVRAYDPVVLQHQQGINRFREELATTQDPARRRTLVNNIHRLETINRGVERQRSATTPREMMENLGVSREGAEAAFAPGGTRSRAQHMAENEAAGLPRYTNLPEPVLPPGMMQAFEARGGLKQPAPGAPPQGAQYPVSLPVQPRPGAGAPPPPAGSSPGSGSSGPPQLLNNPQPGSTSPTNPTPPAVTGPSASPATPAPPPPAPPAAPAAAPKSPPVAAGTSIPPNVAQASPAAPSGMPDPNANLRQQVENMRSRNQANASRVLPPYQPSPAAIAAQSRHTPDTTVGGRAVGTGTGRDPTSPGYQQDVARAQSIARQGNAREAMLSQRDSQFRTPYKPPAEHNFQIGTPFQDKYKMPGAASAPGQMAGIPGMPKVGSVKKAGKKRKRVKQASSTMGSLFFQLGLMAKQAEPQSAALQAGTLGMPKPTSGKGGPNLFGHYLSQAWNPMHNWANDPTDTASDAAFRWGSRGAGAIGGTAAALAGGHAALPALGTAGRVAAPAITGTTPVSGTLLNAAGQVVKPTLGMEATRRGLGGLWGAWQGAGAGGGAGTATDFAQHEMGMPDANYGTKGTLGGAAVGGLLGTLFPGAGGKAMQAVKGVSPTAAKVLSSAGTAGNVATGAMEAGKVLPPTSSQYQTPAGQPAVPGGAPPSRNFFSPKDWYTGMVDKATDAKVKELSGGLFSDQNEFKKSWIAKALAGYKGGGIGGAITGAWGAMTPGEKTKLMGMVAAGVAIPAALGALAAGSPGMAAGIGALGAAGAGVGMLGRDDSPEGMRNKLKPDQISSIFGNTENADFWQGANRPEQSKWLQSMIEKFNPRNEMAAAQQTAAPIPGATAQPAAR